MIELSPAAALMMYLGLTLFIVLFAWSYHHYTGTRKVFLPEEKRLHQCEFCHFAYLEDLEKNITKCPECGSLNKFQA